MLTEVQGAATLVDEALLTVVTCCMSSDVVADALAVRRLRLPARMYGAGLRSVAAMAPAAYIGTIGRTLPLFGDRLLSDGQAVGGFAPGLAQAQGVFDGVEGGFKHVAHRAPRPGLLNLANFWGMACTFPKSE